MRKIPTIPLFIILASCTQAQTKTALDLASIACVIANAEGSSPEILEACKIEQAAAPAVAQIARSVKEKHRAMSIRKFEGAWTRPCERDAGGDR